MRAAVYYNNDDVRLEQRPEPTIGSGEILLRVRASGICGSDLMEWYRGPRAPLILGHEVAGTVEQVGPGVEGFREGDPVVATHHVPCNACRYCLTDRHSVCRMLHSTGFDPGGFVELLRLTPAHVERGTFRLPEGTSFEQGSFTEPLACVLRGQRLCGVRPGGSVAVLGAGLSGLLHIAWARAQSAGRILATDVHDKRLATACAIGADVALHAGDGVVSRLRDANDGRGVDHVIVCVASAQVMREAQALVDDGGTILLFAPLEPDETLELRQNELWTRGISLVHSYAGPPAEMRAALELIARRRIDVEPMISHRLGLAETGEGFRIAGRADEALKVIIEPQR